MPMSTGGVPSDASSRAVSPILLLEADPRTDVSAVDHIRTLVFNGAVVDRNALLTMSKTMQQTLGFRSKGNPALS
jgi:hypothetical protein